MRSIGPLLATMAMVVGCSPETKVGVRHDPPAVSIQEPSEGSGFVSGQTVQFVALVTTSDGGDVTEVLHQWVSGNEVMCEQATVLPAGEARCDYAFRNTGSATVTIQVVDNEGDRGEDTVAIEIINNEAPTIEIVRPADNAIVPSSDLVVLEAIVSDPEDSPDALEVTVDSSLTGDLGVTSFAEGSGGWEDAVYLESGAHQLEFCVADSLGKKDCDKIVVTVNSAPTPPTVSIVPAAPISRGSLTAQIDTQSTDPDNDPLTYRYAWKVDGVDFPNPTFPSSNAVIDPNITEKGEYWEVTVWAEDGYNQSPSVTTATTIGNSPPRINSCSIAPPDPVGSEDLFAVPSGWFDPDVTDPEGYTYRWEKWDVNSWVNTGVTGDFYPAALTARDDVIRVECTPHDGTDPGTPQLSSSVQIANAPPTITACPIFPNNPMTADSLVATPQGAVDADGDTVTFTFKWFEDGIEIPGETTATLPDSYTARGEEFRVECTPRDTSDAGNPVSSPMVTVVNTPPTQPTPGFNPAAPVTGQSILASMVTPSVDADGDNITYSLYWRKNSSPFNNPSYPTSNNTVSANVTWRFEFWEIDLEPSDGIDTGPVGTINVVIANAPPSISSCLISPAAPGVADDLTATPQGYADVESDPPTYKFRWFKDTGSGMVDTGVTGATYPSSLTAIGDVVTVECTPNDSFVDGATVQAAPVQLGNTEPSITGCNLTPGSPDTADNLIATPIGWSDVDGDPPGYQYVWTVNGAVDTNVTTNTYPSSDTVKEDDISVECIPWDGVLVGTGVTSTTITVVNSPPTAPVVQMVPASPRSDQPMQVTIVTPSVDPDGDAITYEYYWHRDGANFLNPSYPSSNPSINQNSTTRGEFWDVDVMAFDGLDRSGPGNASTTIGNAIPVLLGCDITPAVPRTTDSLIANPNGFSDSDGDAAVYQYRWFRDNAGTWVDMGITTATLPSGSTVRGITYKVQCTPGDGIEQGTMVDATPVTVVNTPPAITSCDISPSAGDTTSTFAGAAAGWTDPDGDAPLYRYSWYRNNTIDPAETGQSFPNGKTTRGDTLRVDCTPDDTVVLGSTLSSGTVTIGNAVPTAPVIAVSPGSPKSGQSFTAVVVVPSTDADGDTLTYRYYWSRDGSAYANPSYPSTNNTIGANVSARGEFWDVEVRADDSFIEGGAGSDAVLVVNSEPSISSVGIAPQPPTTESTVVGTPVGWTDYDNDPEAYTIRWYKNGVLDATEVSATYPSSKTTRGNTLRVEFTPYDPFSTGTTLSSGTVTVANSVPTAPVLSVSPFPPTPADNLQCNRDVNSYDADGDGVTYTYAWYSSTGLGPIAGSTLLSTFTSIGEGWWCEATPNDGTQDGVVGVSPTVFVQDQTAPDPPFIDPVTSVRNETTVTLTGTCEVLCDLDFYCTDDAGSWQEADACSGAGTFAHVVPLARGRTTSCYATCTDTSSNVSGNSNSVSTEVCSPYDTYEGGGYGDTAANAINEWSSLPDDNSGGVITITGNILPGDAGDWYRVATTDNLPADLIAGIDDYDFQVTLTAGDPTYSFLVYRGGSNPGDMECPSEWAIGYTDYNDFVADYGAADHGPPTPLNRCGSGLSFANNCNDMSSTYYIEVLRASAPPSCAPYTLEITNNAP